jgi:tetratricopeptide (TPR) repeat protein
MTRQLVRILWAAALVVMCVSLAVPAFAQNGTLSGRVVDSERRVTDRYGQPIPGFGKPKDQTDPQLGLSEATVTLELKGESPRKFQTITDAYGEWYKSGLPPGTYDISVKSEWRDPVPGRTTKLVVFIATAPGVVLKPGEKARVPDMGALTEEAVAAGRRPPASAPAGMSNTQIEAANRRNAELEVLMKDANAASDAGNHAEAVTKLTALAEKLAEDKKICAPCYAKIGEAQVKLADMAAAEAAFLKAIEYDPKAPAPYSQLAALYNSQRKFDEAAKMSAKASELAGGSAGGSGGGDATSVYNQGVIFMNAGKMEEAHAEFAKAVKLNPKHANSQYWFGLTTYSLAASGKGKMIDAKAPFEEYLKLEPTGQYAADAKALLATIK